MLRSGEAGLRPSSQRFVDEGASTGAMGCHYHTFYEWDSAEKQGEVLDFKPAGRREIKIDITNGKSLACR